MVAFGNLWELFVFVVVVVVFSKCINLVICFCCCRCCLFKMYKSGHLFFAPQVLGPLERMRREPSGGTNYFAGKAFMSNNIVMHNLYLQQF